MVAQQSAVEAAVGFDFNLLLGQAPIGLNLGVPALARVGRFGSGPGGNSRPG